MSARRISEKGSDLPSNPTFIDFERSDGDPSSWPRNTSRIVDRAREINYYKELEIDHPHSIRWRVGAAKGIAVASNLPAGPTYVLRDWPAGYKFFDHHKGPDSAPRHDLYLYGPPPARRYRSINEFIPHAIWLYQDATLNPANCQCKYCQKKPQKEVTASLPGILRTTLSTPTPSRARPRAKNVREALPKGTREKVYASVQRAPIPALPKSSHIHQKATMLVERNSDLRAVSSKTAMKLRRWLRTGELLWCALNPPIKGPDGVAIEFWPGLVDEVKLKTKSVPCQMTSPMRPPLENGNNEDIVIDDATGTIPWSVSQSTQYRMQLLAVNHSYLVSDDRVLPYQAHVPPNDLIDALKAFPVQRLDFDREVLSHFNPCPKGQIPNFDDAVAPYAMAVQIGASLSGFWCLTDEWAFEYHAPKPQPPPIPRIDLSASQAGPSSQAANGHDILPNESISSGPSRSNLSPIKLFPNVSGPSSEMTEMETQRLSARILGKLNSPPQPGSPPLTQMRFQGVWWGAERIWIDEFIRLKVPRRCIAPKGAENILAPSGPGKSAREMWLQQGRDISEIGAGARGVFMRLDGLFVVDAVQNDGSTRKECRASGMLYELADKDWEDSDTIKQVPEAQAPPTPPPEDENLTPRFVPAPSPLNPHVPATPNGAPVVTTPLHTETALPGTIPNPPVPSSQLSHPTASHYHLPEAPDGYIFRPILSEGHEAVLSLSMISGRYYPRILSHPLLAPTLEAALRNPLEKGGLQESNNLWALEGLSAGFHNSVDPIHYKPSRTKMVEDADVTALRELEVHKQEQIRAHDEKMTDDVDELGYPEAMDVDQ